MTGEALRFLARSFTGLQTWALNNGRQDIVSIQKELAETAQAFGFSLVSLLFRGVLFFVRTPNLFVWTNTP